MLSVCSADCCVGQVLFCSGILHPELETSWFYAGIFGILGKEVCPRCGLLLFGVRLGSGQQGLGALGATRQV